MTSLFNGQKINILIDKLNLYGIKNNSFKWFFRYLSNRKPLIHAGTIKYTILGKIFGRKQRILEKLHMTRKV